MDTTVLVEELDRNASKLVGFLKETGFKFSVAALMKNDEATDWYLILGVPELHNKGSRDFFAVIYQIIKDNDLKISLNDIKLLDDRSPIFILLKQMIKTGPEISRVVFSGNYINGIKFPDSILYIVE